MDDVVVRMQEIQRLELMERAGVEHEGSVKDNTRVWMELLVLRRSRQRTDPDVS